MVKNVSALIKFECQIRNNCGIHILQYIHVANLIDMIMCIF